MSPFPADPARSPGAVAWRRAEWRAPVPRPRGPRWLFGAALAVSALIHLSILLVLRFSVLVPGRATLIETRPVALVIPGTRVIDVAPVTVDVEPLPPPLETEPRPEPAAIPPAPVTPPPATLEITAPETRARSLAERIFPRASDPRLWIPVLPPAEPELDPEALLEARVAERLAAWNDSMAIEAEAAARALDWTTSDASGNKWGISPGRIHLGSVTIPLPFGFGPPPMLAAEMRGRAAGWSAIQDQVGRAEVNNSFKDRVKAIRALREARRDTTKKSSGN